MFLTPAPLAAMVFALGILMATSFPYAADEAELSAAINARELRAHVYRLSSPEFLGRRGPGAARTANHIEEGFRRLGLKPAFGDSFVQPIPWLVSQGQDRPG